VYNLLDRISGGGQRPKPPDALATSHSTWLTQVRQRAKQPLSVIHHHRPVYLQLVLAATMSVEDVLRFTDSKQPETFASFIVRRDFED